MSEPSMIGRNLRIRRDERGMTQEMLAEKAGVSVALIAKLEQGRRHNPRLTTLAKLASALDIGLAELTGKHDRLQQQEGNGVMAVRDVLLSPSLLPGAPGLDPADAGEPTPTPELQAATDQAWDSYWRGDFGALAAAVPGLLAEARLTYEAVGAAAVPPLAQAYELAACLCVQVGQTDLAAVGAERGITVAAAGDDELLWATMHGTYAWVLLHQARLREAEELAVRVAEQITPSFDGSRARIAVWGNLLMTALAPAAAADRDVKEYVSLATAGAERLGTRTDVYQTGFGPATVAMQTVHAYAVLRQPGKALDAAAKVRTGELRGISLARHLLDVAQAQTAARRYRAAEVTLQRARDMAPVWFRHQGVARSLVTEIREVQMRSSPTIRSLVRTLGLVD